MRVTKRKDEKVKSELMMEDEFGEKIELMETAFVNDKVTLRALKKKVDEMNKGLIERHD